MEREQALREKANAKLDAMRLRPAPQFYELWYRYFDGDPEVVRQVDGHEGPLDESACEKIYARCLGNAAQGEAIEKAGDQVRKSIESLTGTLTSEISAATEYQGRLGGAAEKISKAGSAKELGAVVSGLIADTGKMLEKSKSLEGQLAKSRDEIATLQQQLEAAQLEAATDGLTGICNRKAFDKHIYEQVVEANDAHTPLVLMMLDIDNFRRFNEKYGLPVGDQVLRLVARTLLANVKGRDTAARYGGEEFAILLPGTALKAGIQVAEILRHSIETKEVTDKANNVSLGTVTLSIGVAKYKEGESVAGFVERALAALQKAKEGGRNRVRVWVENSASPVAS
jgi:diguanylate cyclase